ncbi:MAG: MFS transporter, partial [Chloroflexota bacterium]
FGRHRPLAGGLAIIGLGLLALAATRQMVGTYGAMALFGLGFGLLFPAATALVADASGLGERGAAFGLFYAAYSLGVVVGSVTSGALDDLLGATTPTPCVVAAVLAFAVAPLILFAARAQPAHPATTRTLEPAPQTVPQDA